MSVLLQHCALNATSNSQELIPTPESGAASPTDIGAGLDGEIAEEDAERDSESKMIGVGAANKLMEPKPKIKAKAKAKPAGKSVSQEQEVSFTKGQEVSFTKGEIVSQEFGKASQRATSARPTGC